MHLPGFEPEAFLMQNTGTLPIAPIGSQIINNLNEVMCLMYSQLLHTQHLKIHSPYINNNIYLSLVYQFYIRRSSYELMDDVYCYTEYICTTYRTKPTIQ